MNTRTQGDAAAEERARIASLLARYPDLDATQMSDLHTWFGKVATPLDFGLLASDESVASQYRAYRKHHHDQLKRSDAITALFLVCLAAAAIGVGVSLWA